MTSHYHPYFRTSRRGDAPPQLVILIHANASHYVPGHESLAHYQTGSLPSHEVSQRSPIHPYGNGNRTLPEPIAVLERPSSSGYTSGHPSLTQPGPHSQLMHPNQGYVHNPPQQIPAHFQYSTSQSFSHQLQLLQGGHRLLYHAPYNDIWDNGYGAHFQHQGVVQQPALLAYQPQYRSRGPSAHDGSSSSHEKSLLRLGSSSLHIAHQLVQRSASHRDTSQPELELEDRNITDATTRHRYPVPVRSSFVPPNLEDDPPRTQHDKHHPRQYFPGSKLKAINSHFTFVEGDLTNGNVGDATSKAMEILKAHCAPSALLNSKERFNIPRCAEQTRIAVLQTLIAWVERVGLSALLGWLRGPAGAGKSTIAQTLAEECNKKGLLAATFFFSRTGSAERADGDRLVPTIISQLILKFPELRPIVMRAITENPFLFDQSCRAQLEELLVKPLHNREPEISQEVAQTHPSAFHLTGKARLIIIDGLDECNDHSIQIDLLRIIGDATHRLPYPFRFLIVSRPEAHISHTFNYTLDFKDEDPLRLDLDDDPDADADIRHYLELEFNRMRTQHPNHQVLPPMWPPVGAVDTLVERSSKQFIYAAVAVNFIWNKEDFPAQSLQLILDLKLAKQSSERPFAVLDELYTFVFSKVPDRHLVTIGRFFSLLLHPDLTSSPMRPNGEGKSSPACLECCLELQLGQLAIILKPLYSLLSVPTQPQRNIKIYHASLFDFFKDPSRSGDLKFRVGKGGGAEAVALYLCHSGNRGSIELFSAVREADLTNELKQAILDYHIPVDLATNHNGTAMGKILRFFFTHLRLNKELHRENFAIHRHHLRKMIQILEDELIKRKIWPSGKTFEVPNLPFNDIRLNIEYHLTDVVCRFCLLVGWSLVGESGWRGQSKFPRCLPIVFLERNKEFTDRFDLKLIHELFDGLRGHLYSDLGYLELVRAAGRAVRARLQELSQYHEPQEIEACRRKWELTFPETVDS